MLRIKTSIFVHAFLLAICFSISPSPKELLQIELVGSQQAGGQGDNKGEGTDVEIIEAGTGGEKPCPNWFGGIGVYMNLLQSKVIEVIPGYPAEKAGILVGDVLYSGSVDIKGTPGTRVDVMIYRDHKLFKTVNVMREKICTSS